MRTFAKAVSLVAAGWCIAWWGHLAGWRSAQETEIRSIGRDVAMLEALLTELPQASACEGLQQLIELKKQELALLKESAAINVATVVLYPVFAPFDHGLLLLTRLRN